MAREFEHSRPGAVHRQYNRPRSGEGCLIVYRSLLKKRIGINESEALSDMQVFVSSEKREIEPAGVIRGVDHQRVAVPSSA